MCMCMRLIKVALVEVAVVVKDRRRNQFIYRVHKKKNVLFVIKTGDI